MQGAVKLMPIYDTLGIKATVCGPESFTPDHKPLLGMESEPSQWQKWPVIGAVTTVNEIGRLFFKVYVVSDV